MHTLNGNSATSSNQENIQPNSIESPPSPFPNVKIPPISLLINRKNSIKVSPKPQKRKKIGRKSLDASGKTLREIHREASVSGKVFVNSQGKPQKAKVAKMNNCKLKKCGCHGFSIEVRQLIHRDHYQKSKIAQDEALRNIKVLAGVNNKRRVATNRTEVRKRRREAGEVSDGDFPPAKKSRKIAPKYYMNLPNKPEPIKVCKACVESTYAVSKNKLSDIHEKPEQERRGKSTIETGRKGTSYNHTPRDKYFLNQHINSFHYERHHYDTKTTVLFLHDEHVHDTPGMYEDYKYQVRHQRAPQPPLKPIQAYKYSHYQQIVSGLNINFPDAKTDVCGVCVHYKNTNRLNSPECLRHRFHARQAQLARKMDAQYARDNPDDVLAIEIDAKSVSTVPLTNAGQAHYLRNLNCQMILAVNMANGDTDSYVWSEYEANKGVNELISIQHKILSDIKQKRGGKPIKKFIQWSDKCGGQNLSNFNMAADAAMVQTGLADEIEKNFFVSGHSFMLPDQRAKVVNESITKQHAKGSIETPAELHKVTENPFTTVKYTQHKMDSHDFKDFKNPMSSKTKILSRSARIEGQPTRVTDKIQFKRLQRYTCKKSEPLKVRYKYSRQKDPKNDKEPWKILDIAKNKSEPAEFTPSYFNEPLYPEGCVKITQRKYEHLQKYKPYLSLQG